ncbi:MAG: T9SS type A sorting domain-containing protein [Ferruginibacter sp.]
MKQIVFLFFTFLGICTAFAQKPAPPVDSIALKEKPSVHLFPNPAKNKAEIEIRGFDPGYLQVQLIDKAGNLVRNDKRFVFSGNEIIVFMFSEKPGLYILLLKQGEKKVRTNLLIK